MKFFLMFLTLWLAVEVRGESLVTVEQVVLHQVAVGMQVFKAINQNREVSGWEDVASVVDLNQGNRGIENRQGYRLQDRYEFLEEPVPFSGMPGVGNGEIIMIRVTPLKGKKGGPEKLYRYFIYKNKNGGFADTYASEGKLQAMFRSANAELPKFTNLPEVETEYPQGEHAQTPAEFVDLAALAKAAVPSSTPAATSQPPLPKSSPTPEPKSASSSTGFPVVPVAILIAVIVAAVVFFLRRKS